MIIRPPAPSKGLGSTATAIGLSLCKFPSISLYITLANSFLQYFASLTTSHACPPHALHNLHRIRLLALALHFPTHTTRRIHIRTRARALNHERPQAVLVAVPHPTLQRPSTTIAAAYHLRARYCPPIQTHSRPICMSTQPSQPPRTSARYRPIQAQAARARRCQHCPWPSGHSCPALTCIWPNRPR